MSQKNDHLYAMRHSTAHVMAAAIKRIWPKVKLGVGPVIENGFYYDVDLGSKKVSQDDFLRIEAEMKKIIAEKQPFEHFTLSISKAIDWADQNEQYYKRELLNDLKREGTTLAKDLANDQFGLYPDKSKSKVDKVSFYRNGEFVDLCRGPHVANTDEIGAFKLMRVSGVYWRSKETNPQMQRILGVAFQKAGELKDYLDMLEEAKKRDHRSLGEQLDLYTSSPLIGSGLPLYTPRGTISRDLLIGFSEKVRGKLGFQRVWSPHITKKDLYEMSGHWAKFGSELFLVKSQETSDQLVIKPMNCPHHAQIYASRPRSYRDLPIKYMETATIYRDEKTGELHGLSRVRSISQDDSHAYCTPDQVDKIITDLVKQIKSFYSVIGMKLRVRLSLRDESDAYLGKLDLWKFAQGQIEKLAKQNNLDYFKAEGEAAFYGPKIDFLGTDALGREWQVATVQFDFVMPERFKLAYTDDSGEEKRPIMIHCAIMGSFDRFFSVFIEHTAGWFPFWLAPEQVRVLTINDSVKEYVGELEHLLEEVVLMEPVKYNELRYSIDNRNESLGRKIRDAVELKVPIIMVVGPKDAKTKQISIRTRTGEHVVAIGELVDFLQQCK